MTPELRKALTDWLEWVEDGALPHGDFSRAFGLCTNVDSVAGYAARKELGGMLLCEFGDSCTPFGEDDYSFRRRQATQHECPKRLAWVRKVLAAEL